MAERELSILVKAKGANQAAAAIGKVDSKVQKLGKQVGRGIGIGAGVAVADRAFYALGRTIGAIPDLIGDATQAFIEDEASQAHLLTSLRANIEEWDGNTAAIEAMIAARQKLGFTDEEQRESLAGLLVGYENVEDALDAQRIAMDLARFSGVDLATASDTLIRVHAGNFRALKSLGIQTGDVTNETEALAAIYKVTQGQAESFAGTLQGRLLTSQIRSSEAMERLGGSTAKLSADFEEVKAGAFENFATGLTTVTDALNFTNQSMERQAELRSVLNGLFGITLPGDTRASTSIGGGIGAGAGAHVTVNVKVPVTVRTSVAGTGTTLTRVTSTSTTSGVFGPGHGM